MMTTFIARMIEQEVNKNLEQGKNKYRAYFVNTKLYVKWQEEVNAILDIDGYSHVIVRE